MDKSDAEFMEDENSWPMWPVLPVKKRGEMGPNIGVLLAGNGPRVYYGNMYDKGFGSPEWFANTKSEEFDSYVEVVHAGWVVD